ncbi:hypothetical protein M011DRAFT_456725 [Sporormia fimetaria CBS 119925]|uniref:Serine-threonine protein kinase 19 n=1 Tax=Sporormia fimetaria CBS 119925 TaxID=1340428 RepID=A0A6A6VJM0_9PLEO|nr:hypothetical protein M011DRAFT_456725 [Sporormia fimetaria CBS 119925]
MSFQVTPAHSSRVTKSRSRTGSSLLGLRRTASSPSSSPRVRKTSSSTGSTQQSTERRLDDTGAIVSLAPTPELRDLTALIPYIRAKMFEPIPETAAGMNSTRIAEILNRRKDLPPIVSVAHIDALSHSSTKVEREIAELSQAGVLLRLAIPHRGGGASSLGDAVVLVGDWLRLVRETERLDDGLKSKYCQLLLENPGSTTVSSDKFTSAEISTLTGAGFLIAAQTGGSFFQLSGASSIAKPSSIATAGSRHPSGSLAAAGGGLAPSNLGNDDMYRRPTSTLYKFALPNTGSYIKLVTEARTQLVALLGKSKYKEAPLDLLRERWDGGVSGADDQTRAKQARGEFKGILPGRTRKWRRHWGLRFEWILEECVGAGMVECFQTGSVGLGARVAKR